MPQQTGFSSCPQEIHPISCWMFSHQWILRKRSKSQGFMSWEIWWVFNSFLLSSFQKVFDTDSHMGHMHFSATTGWIMQKIWLILPQHWKKMMLQELMLMVHVVSWICMAECAIWTSYNTVSIFLGCLWSFFWQKDSQVMPFIQLLFFEFGLVQPSPHFIRGWLRYSVWMLHLPSLVVAFQVNGSKWIMVPLLLLERWWMTQHDAFVHMQRMSFRIYSTVTWLTPALAASCCAVHMQ